MVSQSSTDASQSVLAGLALNSNSPDAPNSDSVNLNSNCSDAPNSDCVNLSNCVDLPSNVNNDSLNNGMEVIGSNNNSGNASDISECEIVNGNSNDNDGMVNSNDNGIVLLVAIVMIMLLVRTMVIVKVILVAMKWLLLKLVVILIWRMVKSIVMPPLVLLVVTSPLLTLSTLRTVMVLWYRCRLSGLLGNPLSWCLLVVRVLCRPSIRVGAGLRLLRASTPCPLLFLPDLSLEGLESCLSLTFSIQLNHQRQRPACGRQAYWFLAVVAFLICCSHYRLYSGSSLYFSG